MTPNDLAKPPGAALCDRSACAHRRRDGASHTGAA